MLQQWRDSGPNWGEEEEEAEEEEGINPGDIEDYDGVVTSDLEL